MKQYPSIPRAVGNQFFEFKAHVFDKLDGRNVRIEYSDKQGWHKFGSRTQLISKDDPIYWKAVSMFETGYVEPLTKLFVDNKWKRGIVFLEFWGPSTTAGLIDEEGKYHGTCLDVIDINVHPHGLLAPMEFLKQMSKVPSVRSPFYFGEFNWTRGLVEDVFNGKWDVSFEGVVGKRKDGPVTKMAKAKTSKWIEKIRELYGNKATAIITS